MASKPKYSPKDEEQLMARLWSPAIKDDPLAFVMFAFPWGEKGTPLEHQSGPHPWQREMLLRIKEQIAFNKQRMANGKDPKRLRRAVASGRGIGKSSLVAWLTIWMMSCQLGSTTIVAANTEAQLKSRTWAELGKWHAMAVNGHWFDRDTMSLRPAGWFAEALDRDLKIDRGYYYAQAQLWTEENPDAFAGAHNMAGVMLIFDEASGIPEPIFRVSRGFFTEPALHRYWFCFSNPRRNTGPFYELFHKSRKYWEGLHIDARTVTSKDQAEYEEIIEEFGIDSDMARVEVLGQFPAQGEKQFIGRRLVEEATERELVSDRGAPLVFGVDVARFGDDQSVIYFRHGRDGRTLPSVKFRKMDTAELAQRVAELAEKYQPDAIFVDGTGVGGGVVDQLRKMKYKIFDVQFAGRPDDPLRYVNKRAECWGRMREWLAYGAIGPDKMLIEDLCGPEYEFDATGKIKLEGKDQIKKRGRASPDVADALAVTFSANIARRDDKIRATRRARVASGLDYNPLG
jgi:hypothetical protein